MATDTTASSITKSDKKRTKDTTKAEKAATKAAAAAANGAAKAAKKAAKCADKKECCGEKACDQKACADTSGDKCGGAPKFKHVAKKKESSGKGASAAEVGQQLVAFINAGKSQEAEATLYHKNIETVECDGTRVETMKGVREVGAWWHSNMDVHSVIARGPFVSQTGFAVHLAISVTPKGGARMDMHEVCFYRVSKGKIIRAEFLSPVHGVAGF